MEFAKIYNTAVPNAKATLARKVEIAPLVARITSTVLRSSLLSISDYREVNFWDFGVRATPQISDNDSVNIICLDRCYSGRIISKINDSTGELGDLIGWARQFSAPWRNPCALDVTSCSAVSKHEIEAIRAN